MSAFFRAPGEKPRAPSSQERVTAMRRDLDALARRREVLARDHQRADTAARQHAEAGRRDDARRALLERDRIAEQSRSIDGVHSNLMGQLRRVEDAHAHAAVARSMRDGAALMAEANEALDSSDMHRTMVDTRTHARQIDSATRLMARPLFVGGDPHESEAIDEELEKLMSDASVVDDTPLPRSVVAPTTVETTRQVEEDMGL